MKKLFLVLFLFCSVANANEVKCYSDGHLVYSRHAHEISYADDFLVFVEDGTNKAVMTSMDCLIKIEIQNQ